MRILGLDVGDRRIGVALSDPTGSLASALMVIKHKNREQDLETIARLAKEHEVAQIVVGLPRSLSGELGPQAERVQAFAEELRARVDVPIVYWDERLSTVAADRMLIESGARRSERKERIDAAAAAFILQGYLDRLRQASEGTE